MKQDQRIAIVGGGLAGLAAANALKTFGMKAEVFETAPALARSAPRSIRARRPSRRCRRSVLASKIAAVGNTSPGIYTRNMQTGEFLEFNDRRTTCGELRRPYYTFHRADLLDALASGLDPATCIWDIA